VLHVFEPEEGGIPEHVLRLAEGLGARGHRIHAAGPAGALVRDRLEACGAQYTPLSLVGALAAPREDLAAVRAIARLLRASRPQILHVHGQKAGLVGRVGALMHRVTTVYTPHGLVYRTQRVRPRRSARARYFATRGVERALGRRTAAVIGVAEAERRAVVEDGLVPAERAHLVYNGVAPDAHATPHSELVRFRGHGPLLGMVAGLREQKGLPTLLDALELLARDGRAPRFAIVGNGPLHDEVAARVRGGPLAATTLVLPFQPPVEPYLMALDAFVLPSYWEGLPLTVLDCMVLGVPVLATAVDGLPEVIRHGETGYLVAARDPEALAGQIAAVAGDEPGRRAVAQAAARGARECFSLARMVERTEAVYRTALRAL